MNAPKALANNLPAETTFHCHQKNQPSFSAALFAGKGAVNTVPCNPSNTSSGQHGPVPTARQSSRRPSILSSTFTRNISPSWRAVDSVFRRPKPHLNISPCIVRFSRPPPACLSAEIICFLEQLVSNPALSPSAVTSHTNYPSFHLLLLIL
jgi:hypothetical protein